MRQKIILSLIMLIVTAVGLSPASVSALEYQSYAGLEFTINPTITITVSDDLSIDSLAPGSYSDSNTVDVSVATNAVAGYTLTATVGTKSGNSTALTHTSSNNYTFTNLTSNVSDLSSFSDNYWGYSYSVDDGTTWISGDIDDYATGYNGLPLDDNTSSSELGAGGTTLIDTDDAADSATIQFKIGAKAGSTQPAGTYTNTINFYAITKTPPTSASDAFAAAGKEKYNGYYKMQDMTSSICSAIEVYGDDSAIDLIDIRDNEVYKIAKLKDDNCWMLDNLRLDPTNSATAANMTPSTTNATAQAISCLLTGYYNGSACSSPYTVAAVVNRTSGFDSYHIARVNTTSKNDITTSYGISSGKIGAYYNYCAATAGSYCYNAWTGVGDATEDICPSNWRMPAGGDYGEYKTLYYLYGDSDSKRATLTREALSVVLSGWYYQDKRWYLAEKSRIWSSNRFNTNDMYDLYADTTTVEPVSHTSGLYGRMGGASIRCLTSD